tara:strand:+ start:2561 stop:3148 length:588 start_codon:yes stop_codon:yes gene_type:complete
MTAMPEAIATALVAFQESNEAMNLDKTGNRSQYASIGSMMTLVKKAAKDHGIGISFPVRRTENNEYFISPVIVHSSGVSWSSPDLAWPLIVDDMTHCQKLGSAMSYGRRYLLQGILGLAAGIAELDDDDDDDGEANFDWKGWADEALATIKTCNRAQLDKWTDDNEKIIVQAETAAPDIYKTVGDEYDKKMEGFK